MKIAIFGSCVSRDTVEAIPEAEVVHYIARHSVMSLLAPHGEDKIDLNGLSSNFQKRMVTNDLRGSGLEKILEAEGIPDIVLIDLIDERRGFWKFPDETNMTNSLELEACGGTESARRAGARLIEFGTNEHFRTWKLGFDQLINELKDADLYSHTVLLDLEWAVAMKGNAEPRVRALSSMGVVWRKTKRRTNRFRRSLSNGNITTALTSLIGRVAPTQAEEYAQRAKVANKKYRRYREYARLKVLNTISREHDQLRIDPEHKWGPEPFHYDSAVYRSVAASIIDCVNAINGGKQELENIDGKDTKPEGRRNSG